MINVTCALEKPLQEVSDLLHFAGTPDADSVVTLVDKIDAALDTYSNDVRAAALWEILKAMASGFHKHREEMEKLSASERQEVLDARAANRKKPGRA